MNVIAEIQINGDGHASVFCIHRPSLFFTGIRPCVAAPLGQLHIIEWEIWSVPYASPTINQCAHFVRVIARIFTSATVGFSLIPDRSSNGVGSDRCDATIVDCPGQPRGAAHEGAATHFLDGFNIANLGQCEQSFKGRVTGKCFGRNIWLNRCTAPRAVNDANGHLKFQMQAPREHETYTRNAVHSLGAAHHPTAVSKISLRYG